MLNPKHVQSSGDAFKTIFETYKSRLYGYTLSLTHSTYIAEEITQEIFIKLWVCRDGLGEIDNLDGYIFTMARNGILNHLRKAANDSRLMAGLQQAMVAENNNVEEYVMAAEYSKSVDKALGLLSSQPRLVYRLSRQQGLNHEEIARHTSLITQYSKKPFGNCASYDSKICCRQCCFHYPLAVNSRAAIGHYQAVLRPG